MRPYNIFRAFIFVEQKLSLFGPTVSAERESIQSERQTEKTDRQTDRQIDSQTKEIRILQ